ncbi:demethylmenaquinone methyltransferase / 2-methoxy-6-polyprenyl-1,4-benzoquinol methylase [Anaerolineales bacterium]|nr:demethylmenaquinone methyltransferase / 2-methoxy-6-polyprenyl-1,4-benzoquinol methylase [Anaerolineales bacterium]
MTYLWQFNLRDVLRRLQFDLLYFGSPPWDSGITPPEVVEFIQAHPAGRALDIGCGTGTNVITLAKAGWQVTGFDFASRAIQIAKRKIKQAGIRAELFTDDATRMKNISRKFDLVLDIGCFHGIPNKVDYLTQLDRILAPGGFWLMYGFLPQAVDSSAPRIGPADLSRISAHGLTLLSQRKGFDKRERPSAWFLYQKGTQVNK